MGKNIWFEKSILQIEPCEKICSVEFNLSRKFSMAMQLAHRIHWKIIKGTLNLTLISSVYRFFFSFKYVLVEMKKFS